MFPKATLLFGRVQQNWCARQSNAPPLRRPGQSDRAVAWNYPILFSGKRMRLIASPVSGQILSQVTLELAKMRREIRETKSWLERRAHAVAAGRFDEFGCPDRLLETDRLDLQA
jgi:hypothetical protein